MPTIYKPFTEHTAETMWAKLSLVNSGKISRRSNDLSLHMRLFFLGLGRVSNKGHAPFEPGEIAGFLLKSDGRMYCDKSIRNEIARLIDGGLLAPVSNIRCLVYPMELIILTTNKKNVEMCSKHGTHRSWSSLNNDWTPDYLPEVPQLEPKVPETAVGIHVSDWNLDANSIGDGTYDSY